MDAFQWEALALSLPGFGLAFLLTVLLTLLFFRIPWLAKPHLRREKARESFSPRFFRLGGVAMIVIFWLSVAFDRHIILTPALLALLIGSLLILFVGLIDDIRPTPWYAQFLFQVGLGALLVFFGMRIDIMQGIFGGTWDLRSFPLPGLPILLVFLWVALIMNSLNWMDGLDGLLGSVTLIGFLTLFAVSLLPEVRQPTLSILTLIAAGTLFAFLTFNWPPARLLAGTSGAYFLGFTLATLSIFAGAKVATALLVLTVPILDALFVVGERYREKQSLFLPDRRHLHYRLREIGWSDQKISLFLYRLHFTDGGAGALDTCIRKSGRLCLSLSSPFDSSRFSSDAYSSKKTARLMKQLQSLFWIFLILGAFALTLFWWKNIFLKNESQGTLLIGDARWNVEYARTPALREKGLGYRESLPKDQGMLFIFSAPGQYSFWMKGMEFSLDFAFIRDKHIVSIERNIRPEDTRILTAPEAFDSVLEVNAGELEGISPGQEVTGVQK